MSTHLSPDEFVDAVEGVLIAERRAHVDGCDACRREVEDLRRVMSDVDLTSETPEPSPLFWDHLSQRVRQATGDQAVPARTSWWTSAWRPMVAAAAGLAVIALVLRSRPAPDVGLPDVPVAESAGLIGEAPLDEGPWNVIIGIASASGVDWEDVRQVAKPRAGTVDELISSLTPAERQELARMLRAEIGDVE